MGEKHTAVRHTATEILIFEDIREALDERHIRKAYCDRDTVNLKTSGKHWERYTLQ